MYVCISCKLGWFVGAAGAGGWIESALDEEGAAAAAVLSSAAVKVGHRHMTSLQHP